MCASPTPEQFVEMTMALAAEAAKRGDPPFGAVLVSAQGERSSWRPTARYRGTTRPRMPRSSCSARPLGRAIDRPLSGSTIVVNAEPCSMCASALVKAEVGALIYGAPHEPHMDPDLGAAEVFAHSRRPPRVTAGTLAGEAAGQISASRGAWGGGPVD